MGGRKSHIVTVQSINDIFAFLMSLKALAPFFSTLVGVDSDDFGYSAEYDGYSAAGDTEYEAINNLIDKLLDKGSD